MPRHDHEPHSGGQSFDRWSERYATELIDQSPRSEQREVLADVYAVYALGLCRYCGMGQSWCAAGMTACRLDEEGTL